MSSIEISTQGKYTSEHDKKKQQYYNSSQTVLSAKPIDVSIIIPTFNECENIIELLNSIKYNLSSHNLSGEILVVDDNSPDGTGKIVDDYIQNTKNVNTSDPLYQQQQELLQVENNSTIVKILHRRQKNGLISAILMGVESSTGKHIVVMDADFSHPYDLIPRMVEELQKNPRLDIVVASRYTHGGSVKGWPLKRRLISNGAIIIAQYGLGVRNTKDPTSGFFAFKHDAIRDIKIENSGYKILLEILVKGKDLEVKDIPYTFNNRKLGKSKLSSTVVLDYAKAVYDLYRFKREEKQVQEEKQQRPQQKPRLSLRHVTEKHSSLKFLSKVSKFSAVGISGIMINYLIAVSLSNGTLSSLWYMKATLIGIVVSMTSNFLLNKIWTFNDRDFSVRHALKQYSTYVGISSLGLALQLLIVYSLAEPGILGYNLALISAIAIASLGNFLLYKKWTFREKLWA